MKVGDLVKERAKPGMSMIGIVISIKDPWGRGVGRRRVQVEYINGSSMNRSERYLEVINADK
jgi:hypothetical protein